MQIWHGLSYTQNMHHELCRSKYIYIYTFAICSYTIFKLTFAICSYTIFKLTFAICSYTILKLTFAIYSYKISNSPLQYALPVLVFFSYKPKRFLSSVPLYNHFSFPLLHLQHCICLELGRRLFPLYVHA